MNPKPETIIKRIYGYIDVLEKNPLDKGDALFILRQIIKPEIVLTKKRNKRKLTLEERLAKLN